MPINRHFLRQRFQQEKGADDTLLKRQKTAK